jgi:hypothetical protein
MFDLTCTSVKEQETGRLNFSCARLTEAATIISKVKQRW